MKKGIADWKRIVFERIFHITRGFFLPDGLGVLVFKRIDSGNYYFNDSD